MSSTSQNTETLWVEKYRPTIFGEIVGNKGFILKLEECSKYDNDSDQHIMISGPSGVGKFTTAICMMKQYSGGDNCKGENWFCASDNSIAMETLQQKLESLTSDNNRQPNTRRTMIVIKGAEHIPTKMMNNLLETYKEQIRFLLTFNTDKADNVRFAYKLVRHFQFKAIKQELITEKLQQICKNENVGHTHAGLKVLARASQGNICEAINNLERFAKGRQKDSLMSEVNATSFIRSIGMGANAINIEEYTNWTQLKNEAKKRCIKPVYKSKEKLIASLQKHDSEMKDKRLKQIDDDHTYFTRNQPSTVDTPSVSTPDAEAKSTTDRSERSIQAAIHNSDDDNQNVSAPDVIQNEVTKQDDEMLAQMRVKGYKIITMKVKCPCEQEFDVKMGSDGACDAETVEFWKHLAKCKGDQ